jgi:hypothetical protein
MCVKREDRRIKLKGHQRFCVGTKRREIKTLSKFGRVVKVRVAEGVSAQNFRPASRPVFARSIPSFILPCLTRKFRTYHEKCDARANLGVTNSSNDNNTRSPVPILGEPEASEMGEPEPGGRVSSDGHGRTRTISKSAGFVPFSLPISKSSMDYFSWGLFAAVISS